ncbi:hypothetical protein [Brevundimonas sp.]|uniref:hypothetical protein n=1 Tax=Brevundimonas sp. TaxID=1871086 RepID=UPI002EDA432E
MGNSKDLLALNQQFFDLDLRGAEKQLARGEAWGAARNYARLPHYRFYSALLLWRRGEDPRGYIEQGLRVLEDHAPSLMDEVPEMGPSNFHLEVGAVFAFLIGRPYFHDLRPEDIGYPDGRLTVHLLQALNERLDRPAMEAELEAFERNKRHALAAKTYGNYFDILDAAAEDRPVDDLIRQAGRFYDMRAKNAFYSGGPKLEGGGPGNGDLIDYRLGAVLKCIGYRGDLVHAWRWGEA